MSKQFNVNDIKLTSKVIESTATSMDSAEGSKVTSQEYLLNLIHKMDKKSVLPLNGYKEIVRFLINQFNDLHAYLETIGYYSTNT